MILRSDQYLFKQWVIDQRIDAQLEVHLQTQDNVINFYKNLLQSKDDLQNLEGWHIPFRLYIACNNVCVGDLDVLLSV